MEYFNTLSSCDVAGPDDKLGNPGTCPSGKIRDSIGKMLKFYLMANLGNDRLKKEELLWNFKTYILCMLVWWCIPYDKGKAFEFVVPNKVRPLVLATRFPVCNGSQILNSYRLIVYH